MIKYVYTAIAFNHSEDGFNYELANAKSRTFTRLDSAMNWFEEQIKEKVQWFANDDAEKREHWYGVTYDVYSGIPTAECYLLKNEVEEMK